MAFAREDVMVYSTVRWRAPAMEGLMVLWLAGLWALEMVLELETKMVGALVAELVPITAEK